MAKTQQTWNKKEKEKKRLKKRDDKVKKMEARKAGSSGSSFDDMIAYVDENGQITSTPPDPEKRQKVIAENIEIGIPKNDSNDQKDKSKRGVLTYFNDARGYGFIKDSVTQESFFAHINDITGTIKVYDKVVFEVKKGYRGMNAVNIRLDE